MVTPASSYLFHLGLCRHGHVRESLALFRDRFDRMFEQGQNGTLWEEWWLDRTGRNGRQPVRKTRSDAQTESAFPPAMFGEFILGLRPLAPGMRRLSLTLHDCGLTRMSGSLPTPGGWVAVDWDLEEGRLELNICDDVEVELALQSLPRGAITINETPRDPTIDRITLLKGKHRVQFTTPKEKRGG
jgi:hypothetical protein